MRKYLDLPDLLLIAFSAYVVIWAGNALLRKMNMGEYQA